MLTAFPRPASSQLTTRHGFNDPAIDWQLFDNGRKLAMRENRPIFLLAHTTWCPHCALYREVFFDKSIVELMGAFIPVIVDRDLQPDVTARYAPDGDYIPRTMFLTSEGQLAKELRYTDSKFNYFVDYDDPHFLREYLGRAIRHFP